MLRQGHGRTHHSRALHCRCMSGICAECGGDITETWCRRCAGRRGAATRFERANPGAVMGQEKRCSTCRQIKPLSEFTLSSRTSDGHEQRCRMCERGRNVDARARRAAYWATHDPHGEHPTGRKRCSICRDERDVQEFSPNTGAPDGLQGSCRRCNARRLQRTTHGKNVEPGDCCAICGSIERLCLDHDHETGEGRGVLCIRCNSGLGFFRDDAGLLAVAIRYLAEYAEASA